LISFDDVTIPDPLSQNRHTEEVFCTFFAFIKKTGKMSPGHTGLNYSPIAKYVKIGKKECSIIKEKGNL
jgi:hypothetical protein